jgi:uncharacterized membrane protein YeaQ/YmgE (transglycosylase-associated protein family)
MPVVTERRGGMSGFSLAAFLLIGLVAGWLASLIVGGSGLIAYLVSGVTGAFVGPVVLDALRVNLAIGGPLVSMILVSAIGAVIVVLVARLIV